MNKMRTGWVIYSRLHEAYVDITEMDYTESIHCAEVYTRRKDAVAEMDPIEEPVVIKVEWQPKVVKEVAH